MAHDIETPIDAIDPEFTLDPNSKEHRRVAIATLVGPRPHRLTSDRRRRCQPGPRPVERRHRNLGAHPVLSVRGAPARLYRDVHD